MLTRRHVLGIAALAGAHATFRSASSAQQRLLGPPLPSIPDVEFLTPGHPANGPNFNAYNAPTFKLPTLRALCSSTQSVSDVVKWARHEDIPFAIRSTGHGFAGHSQHDQLVIDTSPLNTVEFAGGHVRTGAGARNGAVSIQLSQYGRILGGGTHESVGMAGVTLGGGFGYFTRLAGLLCDQLEGLSLVDANGHVLSVDQQSNPDLFWACKGAGGGSLGVVTELTYRTLEAPRLTYVSAPLIVDAITAAHLLHEWQHWVADLPRTTTMHLSLSWYIGGQFLLNLSGMSLETGEVVKEQLTHWVGSSAVIADQWVQDRTVVDTMGQLYGVPHYVSSLEFLGRSQIIAQPLTLGDAALLLHTLGSYPPAAINLNFEALGGAAGDVSENETAFPHRAAQYIVHATKAVLDEDKRQSSEDALHATMTMLAEHATGGVYVNYPEAELEGWPTAYWGSNLDRLRAVKRRVDPDNVFRHSQSIPL